MIVALMTLIALLMLGGAAGTGWTAGLDKAVKKQVDQEARREVILDALKNHEKDEETIIDALQKNFTDLLEAHINFQSSETSFDEIIRKLKADQARAFELDLQTRSTLHDNLSQEEWDAVFGKAAE